MKEQSDTPKMGMAEGKGLNPYFEGQFDGESVELRALRLTLVRERDEAQAEGVEQARLLGISGSREAALMAKVDAITRERDEARVSVDTLRAAIKMAEAALADIGDSDHEPTDDLAWCERRAQQSLPVVRFALAATEAKP